MECDHAVLLGNISSLTSPSEDGEWETSPVPSSPRGMVRDGGDDDDTDCFLSACSKELPEKNEEEGEGGIRPQSPESAGGCSSISSLTSEGYCDYDIEAGGGERQVETPPNDHPESLPLHVSMPGREGTGETRGEVKLSAPSVCNSDLAVPSGGDDGATPRHGSVSLQPKLLQRRVSFSPDVKVHEIPLVPPSNATAQMQRQYYHARSGATRSYGKSQQLSPEENFLYAMLLVVAVAVMLFSLMPNPAADYPDLSLAVITKGDIYQRADSMLRSQFEVEL